MLLGHAKPVIRGQMLFVVRQILFEQGDQAGAGRPHVNDGHPRQAGKSGLHHKGEIEGIEKYGLAAAHWGNAKVNPSCLFR